MKTTLNFIVTLGVLNSCASVSIPSVTTCTLLSNSLICDFISETAPSGCVQNPERPQEYRCPIQQGYQCLSPNAYLELFNDMEDKYAELSILRRKCN